MKEKVRTLFLMVTIAAGFCLLAEILPVGVNEIAYASPDKRESKDTKSFTVDFMPEECGGFSNTGENPFFILIPGYQLVLDDGAGVHLTITVLEATKDVDVVIDGVPTTVTTRVVEERETKDGVLVEVSRNYFAICNHNNSVFYFGEDVDIYNAAGTEVVSHDGAWLAGKDGAQAGIIMPGVILLGAKYFQEIAPGVAMDRAEIINMTETVETPAGILENCLKTFETTPLDKKAKDFKFYARGIGLVKDGDLELVQFGQLP